MIFLRNNNSIISTISKRDLGNLNPLRWANKLELEALYMTKLFSEENNTLSYVFITEETYGYGYPPKQYYIKTSPLQKGIYVYMDYTQDVIWYNGNNKNGQVVHIEIEKESQVLLNILGDRLVYNDGENEIIIRSCIDMPKSNSAVNICFYDKYGLPQMTLVPIGNYSFSSSMGDEFESVNYGVKYYSTIKPYALLGIGEEGIQERFRNYYEGLCINSPVKVLKEDGNVIDGSIFDSSITANYYGKSLAFSGTLNLTCSEDYDTIIFR